MKNSKIMIPQLVEFLIQENAIDLQVYEKPNNWCDTGIILSATSTRHIYTLCEKMRKEYNITYNDINGVLDSGYIVIELNSIIIVIFTREKREFYDIESLWSKKEEKDEL